MTERGLKISMKTKGRKRTEEQRNNISLGVRRYLKKESSEKKNERLENQRKACKLRSNLYQTFINNMTEQKED